ncbi:unnamed protein product [Cochlearia groenlandica]
MVAITHLIQFQKRLIETTVTNKDSIAKKWILTVRSTYQEDPTVIISLNSKTNPQDDTNTETLQLCVNTKCLILQLLHMNTKVLECLSDLFRRDERFVFVGIDIAKTMLRLNKVTTISVKKVVDVRDLVKVNYPFSYGLRSRLGLKVMAYELLGFDSWKPKRKLCLKDLGNEVLDEELVKYLCVDAYVCYEIGFKMLTQKMPLKNKDGLVYL